MISKSAANQLSLTIFESPGVVSGDQSTCQLWHWFRSWFHRRQWLHFHSQFLSQQGLGALKNLLATFGTCFFDYFPSVTDLVFVDFFWVNRGCEHFRIHASPLESVSFTVSGTTVAQFSLTVSKSTWAGHAEESTCHLWNLFRWRFPSRDWISFRWLFLIPQRLRALLNPRVTIGIGFVHDFGDNNGWVFINSF
jgi:hypothetical protein